MLEFLFWPFLCCLVLAGIYAYLGLHVVDRGVIFVDLSLAQIAALGTITALLAGFDFHSHTAYFFSLGFAVLGAALFALSRSKSGRVPQEAIIGIVYAVASATAILMLDRSTEGAEHIKYILVGNLLAVHPAEVVKIFVLSVLMGGLHWIWRRPFLLISIDPAQAVKEGMAIRFWDFLFYTTFGVVVTSSVAVAGVLLVFSYLVVPSVIAMIYAEQVWKRLAIGWGMGFLASVLGMLASYYFDAPTGASIVCTFGAVLLLAALGKSFVLKIRK